MSWSFRFDGDLGCSLFKLVLSFPTELESLKVLMSLEGSLVSLPAGVLSAPGFGDGLPSSCAFPEAVMFFTGTAAVLACLLTIRPISAASPSPQQSRGQQAALNGRLSLG